MLFGQSTLLLEQLEHLEELHLIHLVEDSLNNAPLEAALFAATKQGCILFDLSEFFCLQLLVQ